MSLTPVKDAGGEYKLGIWVRDNTQGIGTLTFVDEKGRYGALGHGISDVDTGSFFISAKGRYIRRRSWVSRKERAEVRENFPGSYAMNPARL